MKKPMLFLSGFPGGDLRLVDALGPSPHLKNGVYIRYADTGGTDTTTSRFLFDIPEMLKTGMAVVEARKQFNNSRYGCGDQIKLSGEYYPVVSVDFENALFAIWSRSEGAEEGSLDWLRCEDVEFITGNKVGAA